MREHDNVCNSFKAHFHKFVNLCELGFDERVFKARGFVPHNNTATGCWDVCRFCSVLDFWEQSGQTQAMKHIFGIVELDKVVVVLESVVFVVGGGGCWRWFG